MPTQRRFSRDGRLTMSRPIALIIALIPVWAGVGGAGSGCPIWSKPNAGPSAAVSNKSGCEHTRNDSDDVHAFDPDVPGRVGGSILADSCAATGATMVHATRTLPNRNA